MPTMKTAFLGLGLMGYPMAGHLNKQHSTLVWNRTHAKAEAHALEHNTTAVGDAGDVTDVDVLFTCLPTSHEVEALMPYILETAKPGLVWVDCTSGDPATSRGIASTLDGRGIHFLDAPVSGGVGGAIKGQLTTMIGGDATVLEQVQPALESFATKIVHCGPVGAGMAVKAGNQALLAVNILALGEVLLALEANGVTSATALEVINASSGRSNVSMNLFPERVVGRAFPATFALELMAKDVRIAIEMLRESGTPSPVAHLTDNLIEIARRELGGKVDHVAAVQLLERWAKHELGLPLSD
jgi:3-hydroxyisobutyrate dehydrogenase